jgi:hypothetical protein
VSTPVTCGATQPAAKTVALRRLVDGYQISQALYVVATLGIADLLEEAPLCIDEVAVRSKAHAPSLYRVMRALAAVGVFREEPGRVFGLTSIGQCLRVDAEKPVGGWAAFIGRPYHWQAWSSLLETVKTGETAFQRVHGRTGWAFRSADLEETAIFDRAMTDLSRRASHSILQAYDFARFATIVDVGGGKGGLLAAILKGYPALRGVLLDLPHVVEQSGPVLRAFGVADRCAVLGLDFFESVPAGADAYILKSVLHDWADDEAVRVLRNCTSAMRADARLLIIERVLDSVSPDPDITLSDLQMMVGNGGCERSIEEYCALLGAAGLRLQHVTRTPGDMSVLEVAQA